MKVVLVGYMASGKSSIGQLLSKEIGAGFLDLDAYIEAQLGKSIPQIFLDKGEIFFRKIEHEMLVQVLVKDENLVIATGGGTPCYGKNMQTILEKSDFSVYLQLSIPVLAERIGREKNQRPMVKDIDDGDLPEFIGKHLFERRPFYLLAQKTIACDNKSMEAIVAEIKAFLL